MAPEKFRSKAKSVGGFVFGSGMPRMPRCQEKPLKAMVFENLKKGVKNMVKLVVVGGC